MFLEIVSFILYLTLSLLGTAGGLHQLLMFTPLLYITIFFVKCYIFFEYFLISLKYCFFKIKCSFMLT